MVNSVSAVLSDSTVTSTLLSLRSSIFAAASLEVFSVTVYLPGTRPPNVALLLLPFSILISALPV